MDGTRFLRSIRLENLLSYGPGTAEHALEPLNVLIGPNASGKSNLLEALSLLAAAPRDLQVPIREGGGIRDWLWKGAEKLPTATVEVTVEDPNGTAPLRYRLSFTETGGRFELRDEVLESLEPASSVGESPSLYAYQDGYPSLLRREAAAEGSPFQRRLHKENLRPDQSVLSQRRDPEAYPELTYLADHFESIRLYRDWSFDRFAASRLPQKADLPEDGLLEDASNLALVLNDLMPCVDVGPDLVERLRAFHASADRISTKVHGGTVQVFVHEKGLKTPIPATRLSDGTLRYLCLLAVLCHPEPPPVVCIEEPELGLHPDILPELAQLLLEASERTQVFVTTHSDLLVDALSDTPEAVVVCEKVAGSTTLRRLDAETLGPWLEKHRLGELWISGELGGSRW